MTEWINPRYASLVRAWRDTQTQAGNQDATAPQRGFIWPGRETPEAPPTSGDE